MSEINLKLLQSFLLVAEHGSFRKAADAARRSPSAISMQIKELEDQTGMRLFVRKAKQVRMTPEGQALFDRTSPAMAQINDGFRTLADFVASRESTVTIACAPTLAPRQLGDALSQFRRRFVGTTVRLIEAAPAQALVLLDDQTAEFYVGPQLPSGDAYRFEHLIDDALVACIPPEFDHGRASMTFEDLGRSPVIMLGLPAAIRPLIDDIFLAKGIKPNLAFELQSAFTALNFASAGLGIALLPTIAVKIAALDGFRIVPFEEQEAVRAIGITSPKGYVYNGYSERLLGLIRHAFEAD